MIVAIVSVVLILDYRMSLLTSKTYHKGVEGCPAFYSELRTWRTMRCHFETTIKPHPP